MASVDQSPYEILGVSTDIANVPLRKVYRTKIHEHLQNKISAISFRRICRAYETLSDFDKRKQYDSKNTWIAELLLDKYTPQQLAAEPDLIRHLKQQLSNANLTTINAQDPITGHTSLYCAARAGNLEAVKFLTEHGAEPDLSQRTKSTALHAASFFGHPNVVRCLLESGADYRIVNTHNSIAENEAYNDNVKQIFTELKQNAYVRVAANELDWFRANGLTQHKDTEYFSRQTLLHCASKKGYFDMVQWLVEQCSANIDLVDYKANSALHLAAYGGYTDIVKYLLNRGCNPTLRNRWGTTAEEEGSKYGTKITDLFKTIRERNMFEMAQKGVDWWFYYYFDAKQKDSIDSNGISLLYYACRYGHYSVVKWLLEHGANINIQMTIKPRSTPLHVAKYRGHLSIVELLLEYGADVNIKNDFGVTVFTEVMKDTVDKNTAKAIEELLEQYKRNLKSDKLLDVHIYEDNDNEQEPIAKLKLGLTAGYDELSTALSPISPDQYPYFSIARHILEFTKEDPTIVSAVYRARYACSKFIETPIHLICHKTLPKWYSSPQSAHRNPELQSSVFGQQLLEHGKITQSSLKAPLRKEKDVVIDNLKFTFPANSINGDVECKVTTLFSSDFKSFELTGCICLFKIDFGRTITNVDELPVVSITNDSQARLYTLVTTTSCWFASETRRTRLPMVNGIHAFIHYVDIIPNLLSLSPDMFIAAALDKPLKSRKEPVPCKYLLLRERNMQTFPHIAYHGTNIKAIQSILLDGLVVPGTVVSNGLRIQPPSHHFARNRTYFGIIDFADAVFLSPSIHYSSDQMYATLFHDNNQQLIPVLECGVKKGSYATNRSTVGSYTAHEDDDINAIEWRVKDPTNIEINALLFITINNSIAASRENRLNRTANTTNERSSCMIS